MTNALSIQSPCVGQCELDITGQRCLGCGRSLNEIAGWGEASAAEKLLILDRLQDV